MEHNYKSSSWRASSSPNLPFYKTTNPELYNTFFDQPNPDYENWKNTIMDDVLLYSFVDNNHLYKHLLSGLDPDNDCIKRLNSILPEDTFSKHVGDSKETIRGDSAFINGKALHSLFRKAIESRLQDLYIWKETESGSIIIDTPLDENERDMTVCYLFETQNKNIGKYRADYTRLILHPAAETPSEIGITSFFPKVINISPSAALDISDDLKKTEKFKTGSSFYKAIVSSFSNPAVRKPVENYKFFCQHHSGGDGKFTISNGRDVYGHLNSVVCSSDPKKPPKTFGIYNSKDSMTMHDSDVKKDILDFFTTVQRMTYLFEQQEKRKAVPFPEVNSSGNNGSSFSFNR